MLNRITHVKCIVPFVLFMINSRGYCYSCCSVWTKIGNVGKLTQDNSIMDVWNNERMQFMRRVILEDNLEQLCNFKYCPYANKKDYFDLEAMKNDDPYFNHAMDQIMEGRIIMDGPPHTIQVANSGKCNLKCIMCQTNDKCQKSDDLFDEKLFTQIIPEVLPKISRLYLTLKGEVFFNPNSRKFLQTLDPDQYPYLKINLYTNGIMFTPKLWETIRHNRYDCIYVSIDAASKETYEKIRINGNWEILRRNLDFISELRRKNVFLHFCINFCVMKSNYKEMKDFVKMCLELGCDRIYFQKIDGLADVRENINFTRNKRIFAEIAAILKDPVFCRPEVDVTVFHQYQKYLNKPIFFWDDLITKISEWILYYPVKAVFSLAKHFTFVIDIYMFFEKKRIPVSKS